MRRLARILRSRGYRLTAPRRIILNAITSSREHLSPAEIYDRVRKEDPSIGLVTVYRTLEMLVSLGLVCEVHAGGSRRSYLVSPSAHHHHIICSECGGVIDFEGCDLTRLEERIFRETGFKIKGHLLEFLGRCRSCQEAFGEHD
ncbi:MAG: transcriptional repressor [Chloroflexi bacterium]|nr:transcriptional repressor [Chloroflexota bacterium]